MNIKAFPDTAIHRSFSGVGRLNSHPRNFRKRLHTSLGIVAGLEFKCLSPLDDDVLSGV